MATQLSSRLAAIVEALPLRPGIRVLEIGCGPGAAARAIAQRIGEGHILAIDRSAKAIQQARAASAAEIAAGRLSIRQATVEPGAAKRHRRGETSARLIPRASLRSPLPLNPAGFASDS